MTRRKRLVFALAAVGLATLLAGTALLAVDVFLHGRFEKSAGYNVWGYRGPSLGAKEAGEFRVVMLGGSSAYGYGTNWEAAIPAQLEQRLQGRVAGSVRVVNLGYNNEGVYSFRFTLEDYLWLDYDLALLYEGYNDLLGDSSPNVQVFRHESPVYRLTGYLPIFPIVFREKAASLLTAGNPGAAYSQGEKTVFRPGLAARGTAGVLNAVAGVGQALERQLEHVAATTPREVVVDASTGCRTPWQSYCQSVLAAVEFALAHGSQVLVISQPRFAVGSARHDRHLAQQQELAGLMHRRFAGHDRVAYADVAAVVDLADAAMSFDGMHLTPSGNALVAEALTLPVIERVRAERP